MGVVLCMFDMAWQPFLLLPRFHGGPGILQDQTFALWSHVLSNIPMTDPAGAGIYANMTGVKNDGIHGTPYRPAPWIRDGISNI